MSTTLDEKIETLEATYRERWARFDEQRTLFHQASVELARCQLLRFAEKEPTIVEFVLDAEHQYDDEGSYFWSASVSARDTGGEEVEGSWDEDDSFNDDRLVEWAHEIEETDAEEIFGGNMTGTVTVEQLRSALA